MHPGEVAVLCEDARTGAPKQPDNQLAANDASQLATIFDSREEAEHFARSEVATYPAMRCLLFDDHGRGRPALLTVNRPEYEPRGEIGPRFRRWVGGICLAAGLGCGAWEMTHDYSTIWAGTLATRLLPAAAVCLGAELVFWAQARRATRRTS